MDTTTTGHTSRLVRLPPGTVRRAECPAPPEDFSVGHWFVQPMRGRISMQGHVVHLRPQLMDVLVCLVSGDGRTVLKQDVINAVWHDHFVTESALARSVAELRRALEDDARAPHIIETIPKRGYRVIAPIVRGQAASAAAAGPPAPSNTEPPRVEVNTTDASPPAMSIPSAFRSAGLVWTAGAIIAVLTVVALLLACQPRA